MVLYCFFFLLLKWLKKIDDLSPLNLNYTRCLVKLHEMTQIPLFFKSFVSIQTHECLKLQITRVIHYLCLLSFQCCFKCISFYRCGILLVGNYLHYTLMYVAYFIHRELRSGNSECLFHNISYWLLSLRE